MLDLFCGAGGSAAGLLRAWPDAEIVGVDHRPQRHYPFAFVRADGLAPPFDLAAFDFIWASPPCQGYSKTRALHGAVHPKLIEPVRKLLEASGRPYVIENVESAPLNTVVRLCGSSFGLGVRRHRLFESNCLVFGLACRHDLQPAPIDVSGDGTRGQKPGRHRKPLDLAEARAAMGIGWMSRLELDQAIPPIYAEFLARQIRRVEEVSP